MNLFLTLSFLFFVGSVTGWIAELLFRRFVSSANPERKWINPGFCTGPYLPIYGIGLCLLYLSASLEAYSPIKDAIVNKIISLAVMALLLTAVEYIAGTVALKAANLRLWDYRFEWGNINGIICPKFSFIWTVLAALYYFLVHPNILKALNWLSDNLAFSFVIGMFFGIFIIDAAGSFSLAAKLRKYAEENDIIVKYEALKAHIRCRTEEARLKYRFFRPFRSTTPLHQHLMELKAVFENKNKGVKGGKSK